MRAHLICLPCTVRAAYDIATKATTDEESQGKVVGETLKWLTESPDLLGTSPAALHTYVFRLAQKITGNRDPFEQLKRVSNEVAMRVIPVLERECNQKEFKEAFRLAALGTICGNTIDFEVEGHRLSMDDLESSLVTCLSGDLAADDTAKLMNVLSGSRKVLYLLDNAGEIVFDKFFIKMISENYPVKVWAAVKGGPILNDATMEDATTVGLEEVAEVITTGSDHIGLKIDECSEEFLTHLHNSDIIIAKGQGHYESMMEVEHLLQKPIAYILRAKCISVPETLGVPHHGNVVKVVT